MVYPWICKDMLWIHCFYIPAAPAGAGLDPMMPVSPIWLQESHSVWRVAMDPMANLRILRLDSNEIGDTGMSALAGAIASGSAAQGGGW